MSEPLIHLIKLITQIFSREIFRDEAKNLFLDQWNQSNQVNQRFRQLANITNDTMPRRGNMFVENFLLKN